MPQPAVNQCPRSFSAGQLPNHSSPSLLWQHGVVTTLAGCHTAELGPLIQPTQTPLYSRPTLQQLNTPTSVGIICEVTTCARDPLIRITDRNVKRNCPQQRALGNYHWWAATKRTALRLHLSLHLVSLHFIRKPAERYLQRSTNITASYSLLCLPQFSGSVFLLMVIA